MTLLRAPRAPWTLLTLLLAVDTSFIALHHISIWGVGGVPAPDWLHSPRFRVDVDWGYAEGFGYLKLLFVIGLLFHLRRRYGLSAVVWSLVFCYVLLDDAFTVHERYGALLTGRLLPTPATCALKTLASCSYGGVSASSWGAWWWSPTCEPQK